MTTNKEKASYLIDKIVLRMLKDMDRKQRLGQIPQRDLSSALELAFRHYGDKGKVETGGNDEPEEGSAIYDIRTRLNGSSGRGRGRGEPDSARKSKVQSERIREAAEAIASREESLGDSAAVDEDGAGAERDTGGVSDSRPVTVGKAAPSVGLNGSVRALGNGRFGPEPEPPEDDPGGSV
jgi:hypothetical protein